MTSIVVAKELDKKKNNSAKLTEEKPDIMVFIEAI
jgi:hypothetical protein